MIMRAKLIALLCFLSAASSLQALDSLNVRLQYYASINRPTEEMTLASLASSLQSKTTTKLEASEIAFYWITEHISYDFEGEQFAKERVDLQEVLRTQRGNFQTFSQFSQTSNNDKHHSNINVTMDWPPNSLPLSP